MAIATPNTIPKLYEAKILRTLEKNLVAKKLCNAKTSSPITKYGDTVYFPSLADPTIGNYTGADFTYEDLQDAQLAMFIDQQKYFAFRVDDIDEAQSVMDMKNSQLDRAAYGLRDEADKRVFTHYAEAHNQLTEAGVTSATIFSSIARIARVLDEQNVPANQRWMAINPIVKERMVLAGIRFQVENGGEGINGGVQFADYLDFKVYVSNNLHTTGADETQVAYVMAGSDNAIAFADQLMNTRIMPLERSFKMGCSGLYVYGSKVIKAKELVTSAMTFAAESTI